MTYRYVLNRCVHDGNACPVAGGRLLWVMLNPSTADDSTDDPTIRKCIGFTKRWGFSSLSVVNLWALRATKPFDLWKAVAAGVDAVGPENDRAIAREAEAADAVCVAWGSHGAGSAREAHVLALLLGGRHKTLACVGRNKGGEPSHPLMAPYTATPEAWR